MSRTDDIEADAIVAVHTRVERVADIRVNDAAGGYVVRALGERGVAAVFVAAGAEGAYTKNEAGLWVVTASLAVSSAEVGVARLVDESTMLAVGELGGVTAMRSRTALRLPPGIDRIVPMVNGPEAIKLDNKLEQRRLFGDYMANGISVPPNGTIDVDALAALPDKIWVKASNGLSGKGSRSATKADAQRTLAELRAERRPGSEDPGWVIEEHDPGLPLPHLRATVPELQRFINTASTDANHEIRMFSFIDIIDGEPMVRIVPMFRYCAGGADNTWIPVDIDSVESEAIQLAEQAARTLLAATGYKGAHVAVDVYKSKDGRYKMREWNVRDPGMGSWLARGAQLLTASEQQQMGAVANRQHGNGFGRLLARLAKAPYNK